MHVHHPFLLIEHSTKILQLASLLQKGSWVLHVSFPPPVEHAQAIATHYDGFYLPMHGTATINYSCMQLIGLAIIMSCIQAHAIIINYTACNETAI